MIVEVRENSFKEYWVNLNSRKNTDIAYEVLKERFSSVTFHLKNYDEVGMRFENCLFFTFYDVADEAAFLLWSSDGTIEI